MGDQHNTLNNLPPSNRDVEDPPPQPKTMRDFVMPPVSGCGTRVRKPTINANNFEIKASLIQLVQQNQFRGHGLKEWRQVEIFYQGCSVETQILIDVACGGSISNKSPEEAYELLELLASNHQQTAGDRDSRREVYELNTLDTILAQNEQLAQQVASLNKKLETFQLPNPIGEPTHSSLFDRPAQYNYKPCTLFSVIHELGICPHLNPEEFAQINYVGNNNRNP
ncbi:hypothetical protein L6164_028412 [Bauhinia variegata]|uniref:Uncharacterized protein n=1 Tax=Bauhinia variegata TaxID=167791 RepID=A0ACB9L5G3_BAUVA|nr:hypothetical protein L6164_028412 [Bauhinia variegata]